MHKVTFNGQNTSLTKYNHRFEPGKPLLVSSEVAEKLAQEKDFTVEEVQSEPAPLVDDSGKEDEPNLTGLKEQAKAAGIKGYSSMNKPELIEALAALSQKDDPYANAPTS
ncbi:Rho termination factor N-terminal domain-containing protein [Paenibacillus pabuli]|uniref:Rho termination factor N-terminal domain-containing protein n=1 Tax=Paenibacillus pabuli TaxID=1472 RepID=UPI0007851E24|nr:Rho termination factor N-terminal domain-containing protein [Paenibacillus pabuli]MEC0125340.1 Rho termination factor N-terminal domain-containing protein [Paenibacillus pabuli]